jgi:hypothetical protein
VQVAVAMAVRLMLDFLELLTREVVVAVQVLLLGMQVPIKAVEMVVQES